MTETIFGCITEQAKRNPDALALKSLVLEPLSYSRLCTHISYVVETLNEFGVGRNDRVVIVLPHSAELATACLAVIAGAVAVPLNPEYKAVEYESLLSRLEPKLLLTQAGLKSPARNVAQAMDIPILDLSTNEETVTGLFKLNTDVDRSGVKSGGLAETDDVALLLHTSGTTAQPRLVPLTQQNLLASVDNLSTSLELGSDDCCLHMLPIFHIGGVIDVLASPLVVGGSIICTSSFSIPEFFKCLNIFRPTWTQAVPTMIQEILAYSEEYRDIVDNNSLRLMRSVSAPLPIPVLQEFERVFNVPIIEIYGMTETSGLITSNLLSDADRKSGSVGLPVNQNVAIMDEQGNPVPAMQSGEIVVRGNNVMIGYEDANDTNANVFSDGWFRTEDQGYVDDAGYLFLTGRIKDIINRGGEKISPREIDELLQTHPAVSEAATFGIPHQSLGEEVAVAVVLNESAILSKQELIEFLKPRLAYFKVPRIVHFIAEIPKSSGGKLQRTMLAQELSEQDMDPVVNEKQHVPPNSLIAKSLVQMWERVLDVDSIGIYDDFFDLGGDSLKAATFVNELQQKWGEIVYVSALFDAPSISEFEPYLQKHYPDLVVKILGQYVSLEKADVGNKVDASSIENFRASIVPLAGSQGPHGEKNRPAIFILNAPRSGSTLLRAMLGGHHRLFAPPELFLLSFDNLADRKAWFLRSQEFLREGNLRSLMQITNQGLDEVEHLMCELEKKKLPTQDYYRMMQDWLGDRILVDKTPFNVAHLETLRRAEQYFQDPIYIHLVRHPYGIIRSFEEANLDQLWYPRLFAAEGASLSPNPYQRREFAEMIWQILQENILQFLEDIPSQRKCLLKFEDMVGDPQRAMNDICEFLGLDFEPEMLQPLANKRERMTDGIYPVSRMIGDMKFHQHKKIDPGVADLWKRHYRNDFLSQEGWELASSLGYDETLAKANDRVEFII